MVSCWGITGGRAGMAAQVRALAVALQLPVEMKNIAISAPFVWLPNVCYPGLLDALVIPYALELGSDTLSAPWPDVVISCGRRGAMAALGLKHVVQNQYGKTRFIHIQDPHINPKHFDLVVAMEHDHLSGDNVLATRFALHSVTPQVLTLAGSRFEEQFARYPKPHVAVLLGGSTNKYTLSGSGMQQVIAALENVLEHMPGSLLITPSRRTGRSNTTLLQAAFADNPRASVYDLSGENPYMGMLALADYTIVTNDSVNMMSDAYATGKPFYILPLPGHKNTKPANFAERLVKDGIARPLSSRLEKWDYRVNDEMQRLASEIRKRLNLSS